MSKRFQLYILCFCIFLFSNIHIASSKENYVQELMDRGIKAYDVGEYDTSIRLFKEAALEYKSASATLNLGIIYDKELHYQSKAKYFYNKFLKMEPQAKEANMVNSRVYMLSEGTDTEESHEAAFNEKVIKIPIVTVGKKLGQYTKRGNVFLNDKKILRAITEYRKAIAIDKSEIGCFNIAVVYYDYLGFNAKALFFFKRYILIGKNKNLKNIASKIISLIEKNKIGKIITTSPILKLRDKA